MDNHLLQFTWIIYIINSVWGDTITRCIVPDSPYTVDIECDDANHGLSIQTEIVGRKLRTQAVFCGDIQYDPYDCLGAYMQQTDSARRVCNGARTCRRHYTSADLPQSCQAGFDGGQLYVYIIYNCRAIKLNGVDLPVIDPFTLSSTKEASKVHIETNQYPQQWQPFKSTNCAISLGAGTSAYLTVLDMSHDLSSGTPYCVQLDNVQHCASKGGSQKSWFMASSSAPKSASLRFTKTVPDVGARIWLEINAVDDQANGFSDDMNVTCDPMSVTLTTQRITTRFPFKTKPTTTLPIWLQPSSTSTTTSTTPSTTSTTESTTTSTTESTTTSTTESTTTSTTESTTTSTTESTTTSTTPSTTSTTESTTTSTTPSTTSTTESTTTSTTPSTTSTTESTTTSTTPSTTSTTESTTTSTTPSTTSTTESTTTSTTPSTTSTTESTTTSTTPSTTSTTESTTTSTTPSTTSTTESTTTSTTPSTTSTTPSTTSTTESTTTSTTASTTSTTESTTTSTTLSTLTTQSTSPYPSTSVLPQVSEITSPPDSYVSSPVFVTVSTVIVVSTSPSPHRPTLPSPTKIIENEINILLLAVIAVLSFVFIMVILFVCICCLCCKPKKKTTQTTERNNARDEDNISIYDEIDPAKFNTIVRAKANEYIAQRELEDLYPSGQTFFSDSSYGSQYELEEQPDYYNVQEPGYANMEEDPDYINMQEEHDYYNVKGPESQAYPKPDGPDLSQNDIFIQPYPNPYDEEDGYERSVDISRTDVRSELC